MHREQLTKKLSKLPPYQTPRKERASEYKLSLLQNGFPVYLTDGTKDYKIELTDRCQIVISSINSKIYYEDASNEFINTLRLK